MHFQQTKCTYERNITNRFKVTDLQIWPTFDHITYMLRPCPTPQIFYYYFPLLSRCKITVPRARKHCTKGSPLWSRTEQGKDTGWLRWRSRRPDALRPGGGSVVPTLRTELLSLPEMFRGAPLSGDLFKLLFAIMVCYSTMLLAKKLTGWNGWCRIQLWSSWETTCTRLECWGTLTQETNIQCCYLFICFSNNKKV